MCDDGIKNKFKSLLMLGSVCVLMLSCSVERRISNQMNRFLRESGTFNKHHVGLAIYDLSKRKAVFKHNSDRHFIPASNAKLLTFYTSLSALGDSVAGIRYVIRQDSLIFWGTGDPSFLQSRLKSNRVLSFLKGTNKKLFYSPGRYTGEVYGKGWAWDDYNDAYQPEINEFPVMDNLISLKVLKGGLSVEPQLFSSRLISDSARQDSVFRVVRNRDANIFSHQVFEAPDSYTQQVPYKTSQILTVALLESLLEKKVELISMALPEHSEVIYSEKRDSLLKEMMVPSDNFIAEQLLLLCADAVGLEMNGTKVIAYSKQNLLNDLPDAPVWVDGSGLSRYNLLTPDAIVRLLEKIYVKVGEPERLYNMLPAGGKSGTLKNAYPKTDQPFVFGKTGTLSNNYSQSGYVRTKKNKTYLFSFMNNNFVVPTAAVRSEIEKMITYLHEKY